MSGRGKSAGRKGKARTKLPENQETRVFSQAFLLYKYKEKDPPPPPGGHVFLQIQTIFELDCLIQETNVLTKFYQDWPKNVSSRLFTCFHCTHIEKTAPPPGSHVFPPIMTIFELLRDISKMDAKNVTSRVFTSLKMTTTPGGHVF
ncbi:hypothetical protein DPMN_017688 [Dreissena polymorpha]|uniref:Uncharacterized protein n=1 Tax=Dreissena polymorpha TaxID=45954 RepID=A0A9D4NDR2_DREPO|nr:hypothetical protein DPMN_017688 [Dreissena polymorpha]